LICRDTESKNVGIVRGITVRSRSIVGNFFGGIQTIFGGNISIYTNLCEQARMEAYELMCKKRVKTARMRLLRCVTMPPN
jgi:uncharacterized protein YbjQ (UPF0145 family)